MNVPVLSAKQRRKSFSGMKTKRRAPKTILTLPDGMKINVPQVNSEVISTVSGILGSLLPGARLPVLKTRKKDENLTAENATTTDLSENRKKRSQYLLGVNCVSKGIRNETAACVLFESDIKPKLLINHLIVLCTSKNIPYIFLPGLRTITKISLGFSCIVLGFKKNCSEFSTLINLVASAAEKKKKDDSVDNSIVESCVAETFDDSVTENNSGQNEQEKPAFTYLYRDSSEKRIFAPGVGNEEAEEENNLNFIPLPKCCDDETDTTDSPDGRDELSNSRAKYRNRENLREKSRKNKIYAGRGGRSVVGGVKAPFKYHKAKVVHMKPNPDRVKQKKKKLKKIIPKNGNQG